MPSTSKYKINMPAFSHVLVTTHERPAIGLHPKLGLIELLGRDGLAALLLQQLQCQLVPP